MATPGFIPRGEKFLATIKRAGLEEVVKDSRGRTPTFDSAAAAVIHAKRFLREEDAAWHASRGEPETPADIQIHRRWKLEKAEELRREREKFEMRGVAVVVKKRRYRP